MELSFVLIGVVKSWVFDCLLLVSTRQLSHNSLPRCAHISCDWNGIVGGLVLCLPAGKFVRYIGGHSPTLCFPGYVIIFPFVDQWIKVDMRTKAFSVPPLKVKISSSLFNWSLILYTFCHGISVALALLNICSKWKRISELTYWPMQHKWFCCFFLKNYFS